MDPFKSNIDHLTPELMEKYLNGTLSKEESYEVEKLMIDSNFESEAFEGYAGTYVDLEKDLAQLNQHLSDRIQQEKRLFPLWFKIAASILLLAVSTFFVVTYDFDGSGSVGKLAQGDQKEVNETQAKESEPSTILEKDTLIALNQSDESEESELLQPEEEAVSLEPKPMRIAERESTETREPIAKSNLEGDGEIEELTQFEAEAGDFMDDIEMEDRQMETIPEKKEAEAVSPSLAASESVKRSKRNERNTRSASAGIGISRKVKGKVISAEDGEALPGVNIVLKGTSIGTLSDIDGNYSLDVPDNDENALIASFIGLNSTEVDVGSSSDVDIELTSDVSQLSEVVVTGYGIASRKDDEPKTIIPARPEGGKSAYKEYLEKNVIIPMDSITGKVVVKFDVLPNGNLINFKVNKSPGPAYEAEAIRLIKEGPKWRPATENDSIVTDQVKVRVRFK
ncbi:MAG: TonB family protein [Bacteroidota bacterium]